MTISTNVSLTLPDWVVPLIHNRVQGPLITLEDQMNLVIELSAQNMHHQTGGPFGAAIFDCESGNLVSVGVNRVVPNLCSLAHAEAMAFALAQQRLGAFDLGATHMTKHRLVTSAQMCVMCYGALLWSGVREVYFAATARDVETLVGFDEGPLHENWIEEASKRGVLIHQGPARADACAILKQYKESGQCVYNARATSEGR